jgi:hypothetical protein
VDRIGRWEYSVASWVDHIASWREEFARRVEATTCASPRGIGAALVRESLATADEHARPLLEGPRAAPRERARPGEAESRVQDETLFALARRTAPRQQPAESPWLSRMGRPRARALQHLVRDLPAIDFPRVGTARHVR